MTHRFYSAALLGLVLSASFYSLTRAESAYGQESTQTDSRQAVSAYVMRTREIDQNEFTFKAMPDQGNLKVYRVVVTADISWIQDIERIFDVHVDPVTGEVTGEQPVRL